MSKDNGKPKPKLQGKKTQSFTEREEHVLKKMFDIENHPNLEEVGKQFDITRERIREIEKKALKKSRKQGKDDGPNAA